MEIRITDLKWQHKDRLHMLEKHGVSQKEAEQVLNDKSVIFIEGHSYRILALGRVGKRLITLVLTKQKNKFIPVTARDMSKEEREYYREKNS